MGKPVEAGDMQQADRAADVKGILFVFVVAVLGAVYYVSGWAPGI